MEPACSLELALPIALLDVTDCLRNAVSVNRITQGTVGGNEVVPHDCVWGPLYCDPDRKLALLEVHVQGQA